jgi:hypothetical protein
MNTWARANCVPRPRSSRGALFRCQTTNSPIRISKICWGYLYILKTKKQTRRVHYKTYTETYTISVCFNLCFYSIVLFHSGYLLTRKSLRISLSSSGTCIIKPGFNYWYMSFWHICLVWWTKCFNRRSVFQC